MKPNLTDPDDPDYWSRLGSVYDGSDCKHCGRQRVEFYEEVSRRICEKCNWDQEADDYAYDHHRIASTI